MEQPDTPPCERPAVRRHARITPSLTRTELYAAQLRNAGLKTHEIAHALGWTIAEAQTAHSKVRTLRARA
jgi:hypothetical protein